MTKKRKIEVLEILKNKMEEVTMPSLCRANTVLFFEKKITDAENIWIDKLIRNHKPENSGVWYWERF